MSDYEQYRTAQIAAGEEYQDFVDEVLRDFGIMLTPMRSKKRQYEEGENSAGVEIKYQKMLADTENLYIEIAEKARPREGSYVKSGIYRDDNSWLLATGNYRQIDLFAIKQLRAIFPFGLRPGDGIIENKTKTSLAYLMKPELASAMSLVRFNLSSSEGWERREDFKAKQIRSMLRNATNPQQRRFQYDND